MAMKKSDFACPHCGENLIKNAIISLVRDIQKELGSPIIINSGYRCTVHNKLVGGKTTSQHLKGKAADITTRLSYRQKLYDICKGKWDSNKIGGLGIYSSFRHVDVGPHRSWNGSS